MGTGGRDRSPDHEALVVPGKSAQGADYFVMPADLLRRLFFSAGGIWKEERFLFRISGLKRSRKVHGTDAAEHLEGLAYRKYGRFLFQKY